MAFQSCGEITGILKYQHIAKFRQSRRKNSRCFCAIRSLVSDGKSGSEDSRSSVPVALQVLQCV